MYIRKRKCCDLNYKIENGNNDCTKETTIQPTGETQQKAPNRTTTQKENQATGGRLQYYTINYIDTLD